MRMSALPNAPTEPNVIIAVRRTLFAFANLPSAMLSATVLIITVGIAAAVIANIGVYRLYAVE